MEVCNFELRLSKKVLDIRLVTKQGRITKTRVESFICVQLLEPGRCQERRYANELRRSDKLRRHCLNKLTSYCVRPLDLSIQSNVSYRVLKDQLLGDLL